MVKQPSATPDFFTNRLKTGSSVCYSMEPRFQHLLVEDGLPHATVLCVLQDQLGFMWFATADGLARYDSHRFVTFRHRPGDPHSLSNNNTFALLESRDGLLWVGTDPGGLNVYDPRSGHFSVFQHDPDNPNSLINNSVWALIEDRAGRIWAGTRGGLSVLDRSTGSWTNFQADPGDPHALASETIYRIYEDRAGVVWVGTTRGLHRYNSASRNFTRFNHNNQDPHSISSDNVWALLEDCQGRFWVGARRGGLNLMDRQTGKFRHYTHNPADPGSLSSDDVFSIYEDRSGSLWICTESGGVNLFDPHSGLCCSFQHNPGDPLSLSNNDIYWMTEDRSGALWFASRYGGVNLLSPVLQRFGLYHSVPNAPNSLSSNNVYAILAEADVLWVGTSGGGVNRVERSTGRVTVYQYDPYDPGSLSNNKVGGILRDRKGVLWVTTAGGGLNRLDLLTGAFSAFRYTRENPTVIGSSFLTCLARAGGDCLWVGTLGYGLDLFNTLTGRLEREYFYEKNNPNSLSEDTIYDLAVEPGGRVWIATARGGLDLLDPAVGQFTHHLHDPASPNSILSNTVHAVHFDERRGMVWAGTAAGLSGLDLASGQWHNYTTAHGLPSSTINGIEQDQAGSLWISTGKGLSHFQVEARTFINYDARDGLQGDQFNLASSSASAQGELFFGGSAGLTCFYPHEIVRNTYLPPVVFTGLSLFDQPVAAGSELLPGPIETQSELRLRYDQSVLTFRFAVLSYQAASKNMVQYKMDGMDREWSPVQDVHEARYTNLAPGRYTFLVRGINNDGVQNPVSASIRLHVSTPWWQTWWFRALAALGSILLVALGFRLRLRAVRAANQKLEQRVKERTYELQEADQRLRRANQDLQAQLEMVTHLEQRMREQAIRDALTGLYNRYNLPDKLESEIARARRKEYPVAFMLLDLDHFKQVNDRYGHQVGDTVLKAAAQLLTNLTRRSDIVCRYGGEEFLIVMPEITQAEAERRAAHFCHAIRTMVVPAHGHSIHITVSIGLAMFPNHGSDADTILSRTDQALYQAKTQGRDRYVMY